MINGVPHDYGNPNLEKNGPTWALSISVRFWKTFQFVFAAGSKFNQWYIPLLHPKITIHSIHSSTFRCPFTDSDPLPTHSGPILWISRSFGWVIWWTFPRSKKRFSSPCRGLGLEPNLLGLPLEMVMWKFPGWIIKGYPASRLVKALKQDVEAWLWKYGNGHISLPFPHYIS